MSHVMRLHAVWDRVPALARLVLFGLSVLAVGLASVSWFRPTGSTLAVWWPAAGLGLVGILIAERHQRVYVLVAHFLATTTTNLVGGQLPTVALLLGTANAGEILLIYRMLAAEGRVARDLHDLADVMRFVKAVVIGAALVAAIAAAIISLAHGTPPLTVFRSIAPSHVSALLVFGILAMRGLPTRTEAQLGEATLQWITAIVMSFLVFLPGQHLPLVFLIVPVLLWGVLRSNIAAVGTQLATVATIAAAFTVRGGGPFAVDPGGPPTAVADAVALAQLFLISVTLIVVVALVVVQQRRDIAAELVQRERRARVAFERGLTGLIDLRPGDEGLTIVELNRIACRFFDSGRDTLVGTTWCDMFEPGAKERLRSGVNDLLHGQINAWHGELPAQVGDEDRWFEVAIFPSIPDQQGALLHAQLLDVTDRRRREDHLVGLALRDGLTGLANRLVFDDHLDQAMTGAARDGSQVGVLYLDLDGFKPINDRWGHEVGDAVLATVAERLVSCSRAVDTVARIGGDEFAVVLPGLGDDATRELLEVAARMRRAVKSPMAIEGIDEALQVGVSIGVAVGSAGDDPREVVRQADEAMYRKKNATSVQA